MKSSARIQVYRAHQSQTLQTIYYPILSKRYRNRLGNSSEYLDMQKAADALIKRYLRGRFAGMEQIGYPKETPYIDHPPRDGGGDLALDPQLRICIELVHTWPAAINGIIREYWGEDKSQSRIAYNYKMSRKKVSGIISTIRHHVIQKCIEPFTVT